MAVNKVIYGSDTLIDLTADTVTADKLKKGETAHSADGKLITGTMSGGHTILNSSGTSMTQRSYLQFGGGLTTSDDSANGKTVVSVDVTNQITQSETKPVSSGAVYTAIGNIETLLASI